MKASYRWILDYLPGAQFTPKEMAELLTFSGTEVESSITPEGDDFIFEIGVTSNRVDELCHFGLAREVAAVSGLSLEHPPRVASALLGPTLDAIRVSVESPELCPRLTVRVLEGVRVGPSPAWLVNRLRAVGVRSINNVVDVSNFILWEQNQPLHAFDLDCLHGSTLVARRARAGEKLLLLNDRNAVLTGQDLVLADAEGAVGLAGIMGGSRSEVTGTTTRIALESAWFSPASIRGTSRRHQLRTDASHRFERGIDRANALAASERAARLILELAGGQLRRDPVDLGGPGAPPKPIELRCDRVAQVLGLPVSKDEQRRRLESLELTVQVRGASLDVTPPSFRADLTREIDLIEEITRLSDLEALPDQPRMAVCSVPTHPARELRDDLKDRLVSMGYTEVLTPDFVKEGLPAEVALLMTGEGLQVRSPIRSGESALRRSLLPSLLRVRKHNTDQGNDDAWIFESANLHENAVGSNAGVRELRILGGLLDGSLRDARGSIDRLLAPHGIQPDIVESTSPFLMSGARAEVRVHGELMGVFGKPSALLIREFALKACPVVWELNLEILLRESQPIRTFTGLPKFPASMRDLTLDVSEATPYADLERELQALSPPHLEEQVLLDIYRGKNLGPGRKSWTVRFTFRSKTGTMTTEQVDAAMREVMATVEKNLHAQIRKG